MAAEAEVEHLRSDYLNAGFFGSLGTGTRRALVLVDLTYAYLDPASPLYAGPGGAPVVEASSRLLGAARGGGCMVVHTRLELQPGGRDGGLFRRKVPALEIFESGGHLSDPPPALEPTAQEIMVRKQYASAFFGTSLASTLRASAVDAVVIGGASTSGCVRATCVDAKMLGYKVGVVEECVFDRNWLSHKVNLYDMNLKYADVVFLDQALEYIQSIAVANSKQVPVTA
jgi:maleamate amidohydrolase